MVFQVSKGRLSRVFLAAALMLLGEGAARACSCLISASPEAAREIATEAAIVAEFEVVEEMDFATGRGALVRPVRTFVGKPQPSYRLKFTGDEPCSSSTQPGWVMILYRAGTSYYEPAGWRRQPDLAEALGKTLKSATPERDLVRVRAAVAARRLDEPAPEYEESGICLQIALKEAGAIGLVRREAARAGREVPPLR